MKRLTLEHTFSCSEDWDKMTGDEQRRLCAACNCTVTNISAMTEREAVRVTEDLLQHTGEACIAFEFVGEELVFKPERQPHPFAAKVAVVAATLPLMACEPQDEPKPQAQPASQIVAAQGASAAPIPTASVPQERQKTAEELKAEYEAKKAQAKQMEHVLKRNEQAHIASGKFIEVMAGEALGDLDDLAAEADLVQKKRNQRTRRLRGKIKPRDIVIDREHYDLF